MYKSLTALVFACFSATACTTVPYPNQNQLATKPHSIFDARCDDFLKEGHHLHAYGIENMIANFEVTIRFPPPRDYIGSKYNLRVYNTKVKNIDIKTPESTAEKMYILNNGGYDVVELLAKNGKGRAVIHYGREISKDVRVSYSVFDFDEIELPVEMANEVCNESHPAEPIAFAGNLFNLLNLSASYESMKNGKFFKLPYPPPSPKPGVLHMLQRR